jgi:RHS repeat-associated protein
MFTDKLFTGQREITGLGIYHYGARFYSTKTGRFLSPDSIVPGAGNPQAFNRYSYVLGNPLRYTDPTGHIITCEADEDCNEVRRTDKLGFNDAYDEAFSSYGVKVSNKFTKDDKIAILLGISAAGKKFASDRNKGETASNAFKTVNGSVTFVKVGNFDYQGKPYNAGCKTEGSTITCAQISGGGILFQSSVNNIVHELGHVFDPGSGIPQVFIDNRNDILHDNHTVMWQSNTAHTPHETFGDFFTAWVFDVWGAKADDVWKKDISAGSAKHWMTTNMSEWLQP